MACCSWGVITGCWDSLICCLISIVRQTRGRSRRSSYSIPVPDARPTLPFVLESICGIVPNEGPSSQRRGIVGFRGPHSTASPRSQVPAHDQGVLPKRVGLSRRFYPTLHAQHCTTPHTQALSPVTVA